MPADVRRDCPALIIDDESDQATPNTGDVEERTRINQLIIDIRGLLPTSTYLGYTATPFANVLIDPTHEEDLYPSDFIIALPQPEMHDGPEVIFGRDPLEDGDDPDDGRNMVRIVPDIEAEEYRPPRKKDERSNYEAPITETLDDALRWFLLTCAVRFARGHGDAHMSMLVHTTMYAAVHLQHRRDIERYVQRIGQRVAAGDQQELFRLQRQWEKERDAVDPSRFGHAVLDFEDVRRHLPPVFGRVSVAAACRRPVPLARGGPAVRRAYAAQSSSSVAHARSWGGNVTNGPRTSLTPYAPPTVRILPPGSTCAAAYRQAANRGDGSLRSWNNEGPSSTVHSASDA